jgi:hypothetical protein
VDHWHRHSVREPGDRVLVAETALEFISRPRELGCKFLQSSLGKEVRALLRQKLAIARLLMKNLRVHPGVSSTYFKA